MDSITLEASQKGPDQTAALLDSRGVEAEQADPGIVIKFAPKAIIPRLLSLTAILNISDIVQGINEDDSFRIFVGWLNGLVSKHAGPAAAVRTLDNKAVSGLYRSHTSTL
uniref:Uncharacterized protein n=1 Tax=Amphimedon queenslandica TaxID=400682 RepID=A0A1X7VSR5_AMPQE